MKLYEANLPHIDHPRIGFLASRNGSDMQAIVAAIENDQLNADAAIIISNNSHAPALQFGREHTIPSLHISQLTERSEKEQDRRIRDELLAAGVNLVILSGYMRPIGPETLAAYEGKILNVHPALDMKRFAGRGMYGDHVHKAVLDAEEKKSGATIHIVDAEYDHGPIVAQQEVVVDPNDTIITLRNRVQAAEKILFVDLLAKITTRRPALISE